MNGNATENPEESLLKDKHNKSKALLESWLSKTLKIQISDGRTLIGNFFCTDRDLNIILDSCLEYYKDDDSDESEEPRSLGLVMVPGKHIISINVDIPNTM